MKKLIDNYLKPVKSSDNGSRLNDQKMRIIQAISQRREALTIPELSAELKITAPTCIKLVNQLVAAGIINEIGKKQTRSGRKPSLYALDGSNFQVIGVEILMKRVSFSILDNHLNPIFVKHKTNFALQNTKESLDIVLRFIKDCMKETNIQSREIIGMGVGITGRVKKSDGESLTYFNFMGKPLAHYFSEVFHLPVFLNNDTRCFGMAEKIIGKARNVSNAIIINLSRGLGTSLIINNAAVEGGAGFAGELGHMQWGLNDKVCICGKRGCLGNEVSGYTLEEQFKERISKGEKSLVLDQVSADEIRYDDILNAANKGDALSIELLQQMGLRLGRALGNIINLLNPELIIIGGKFAKARDILVDPVKTGMASSALVSPLKYCEIDFSEMGDLAGMKGAGALVLEHFEFIK
ncbi:MAG: ROK family transcriptional regulator [Bacteroides sp.]|jgi:predicted NBD/HSP70 family sugar kinase|nr:ROK family transcriptional regulator [Bacteroides sp.]